MRQLLYAIAIVGLSSTAAMAEGDPAKGEKVFRKCKACHAVEEGKNKVGPSLYAIVGRDAGSVDGFKYSDAMMESGLVWDAANIDGYLADPKGFIPKNKMAFAGLKKEQDRADVIAYLESLN